MTAWAFPNATMRTTDTRGQWWGPLLRLPEEVQEDEEAQGDTGRPDKEASIVPVGHKCGESATLPAHLDQVPLNYQSETVVQPSSPAHFH